MMNINVDLLQWLTWFLDKKSSIHTRKIISSEYQQLAEELHKPILRTFKKRQIYSSFKDGIFRVT